MGQKKGVYSLQITERRVGVAVVATVVVAVVEGYAGQSGGAVAQTIRFDLHF
jgi:hypothetical protein